MEKIYKPNVGWVFWAHLILILIVIVPLLAVLMIVSSTKGLMIPVLLVLLAVVLLSMLVLYRTKYTMDYEKITVGGVFKKLEIPYRSVTRIVSTDKGLAGGAGMLVLSPDRIIIFFGENAKASISPRDKPDALSTLRSYCPNAEYAEDMKAGKEKAAEDPCAPECRRESDAGCE